MKKKFKLMSIFLVFLFLVNFMTPINAMAFEGEEEALLKEINEIRAEISNNSDVDYLRYLTFRALDEPIDINNLYLGDTKRPLVYCQNIIKLFAAKADFTKEENSIYVNELKESLGEKGFILDKAAEAMRVDLDLKGTSLGIIALNMVKEDYDKDLAFRVLCKYIDKESDGTDSNSIQSLCLSLIALKAFDNGDEYINKVKEKLQYCNTEGKITGEYCDDFGCESEQEIFYNSLMIQALVALGEDPTSEEWTDEGKNLLDGLRDFEVRNESEKISKLAALVDYYNFKYKSKPSMYFQEYKTVYPKSIKFNEERIKCKIGKETELDFQVYDNNGDLMALKDVVLKSSDEGIISINNDKILPLKEGVATIEVSLKDHGNIKTSIEVEAYSPKVSTIEIKVNEEELPLKVKDNTTLSILTLDEDGDEVKDSKVIFESDNEKVAIVNEGGVVFGKNEGFVNIKAYVKDNESVSTSIKIQVTKSLGLDEITKDQEALVKKQIDDLLLHYKEQVSVEGIASLALSKFSVDKKIYISRNLATCYDYAKALFALKGSNGDFTNYNGRNLLEELASSQVKEGEDKGLFIKNYLDKTNLAYQSYAVLALDLCGCKYDKDAALEGIIKLYKNGKYNVNSFSDAESKAVFITMLAGCKRTKEIDKITKEIVTEFKNDFNNNVALNSRMEPRAISMVIEALVANNISPMGKSFTNKEGKNLVDNLLKYRSTKLKYEEKIGGFTNGKGEVTYDESTSYGFTALTELYTKKSIFGVKSSLEMEEEDPPVITIEGIKNNELYRDDVNVKITSTKGNNWTATLNDKPFKGEEISHSGIYTLVVQAIDENGNKSSETLKFIIDKNPKSNIRVRIEGRDKILLNEDVMVGDGIENILDLLKLSVGCDGVEGKSKGDSGYFVTSILGTVQGDNYGWCYALVKDNTINMPMVSMDNFKELKDKDGNMQYDELIFFIADYIDANIITKLPKLEYRINDDKINLKLSTSDGVVKNKPVIINKKDYTTDDNGEINLEKKTINGDVLEIYIGERDEEKGGILIVPLNFKITLENTKKILPQLEYKENKNEVTLKFFSNEGVLKNQLVMINGDKYKTDDNGEITLQQKNLKDRTLKIALSDEKIILTNFDVKLQSIKEEAKDDSIKEEDLNENNTKNESSKEEVNNSVSSIENKKEESNNSVSESIENNVSKDEFITVKEESSLQNNRDKNPIYNQLLSIGEITTANKIENKTSNEVNKWTDITTSKKDENDTESKKIEEETKENKSEIKKENTSEKKKEDKNESELIAKNTDKIKIIAVIVAFLIIVAGVLIVRKKKYN
ncbi:Ig-like domain (group 2) [Clostridium collagenovorans DSM 3089]|uniref:Ig-like domain (Group 2) n=1 Tax=Clostridium collagenovorans DSM 3089 TaxID=1121306 RepID=A0A1M5UWF0_9CLOT|nr:Ig-like domain-containing protein [Clostridium collagenovorans]SHH67302.1 Ig-like domain (group 2) [Clostridium collagenovorans DSM 3089]